MNGYVTVFTVSDSEDVINEMIRNWSITQKHHCVYTDDLLGFLDTEQ